MCFILNRNIQETHTIEAGCLAAPREGRALAVPSREVGGRAELLCAFPLYRRYQKEMATKEVTYFLFQLWAGVSRELLVGR